MMSPRYLAALGLGVAIWCGLFLSLTWIIDPYGVSPVRVSIDGVNDFKPKRVDIDRIVKPYEVWRYQPRTVFLGTSRIHQSINPAVFDGTRFASAYNASIPASTLSENAAHLEQFFALDPNLEFVFIELFLSNFVFPNEQQLPKSLSEFVGNSVAMQFSWTAIRDSLGTIWDNRKRPYAGPQVTSEGYWLPPAVAYAKGSFGGYVDSIMKIHNQIPDLILQPTAFDALDKIVAICQARGAKVYLIISPNHPYDDYRWLSLGYWSVLEAWYRKLASYPNVISFSQYHKPLEEPIKERMEYWYDPIHFSLKMGNLMLRSFLGQRTSDIPENMSVSLSSENVEQAIVDRRQGLDSWIKRNPEFVVKFDAAKLSTGNDEASRRWRKANPVLVAKQAAEEEQRQRDRNAKDSVQESIADLTQLVEQVTRRYPSSSIKEYSNITADLLAANAVPRQMIRRGNVENFWTGRVLAQVFPSNAWRAGVGPTLNFVFEAVPRSDCKRLVDELSHRVEPPIFRINLEPSGKVYETFPLAEIDGCVEGFNSIGYTVIAQ